MATGASNTESQRWFEPELAAIRKTIEVRQVEVVADYGG